MCARIKRWAAPLMLAAGLAGCGGGGPSIEMTADRTSLPADGETMLHVEVSSDAEQTVELSTDVGGLGIVPEENATWTTGFGRADVPFTCDGETGTATIEARWVEQDLSTALQISCG